jgi:hypothetical protein
MGWPMPGRLLCRIAFGFAALLLAATPGWSQSDYSEKFACAEVPMKGFQFTECWRSKPLIRPPNSYIGYKLLFRDGESEVLLAYTKAMNSTGWFRGEHTNDLVSNFRQWEPLLEHLKGMNGIGPVESQNGDRFFGFFLPGKRCRAFNRFGDFRSWGYGYVARGYFCRGSEVTIEEVRFFTDRMVFQ